jgi:hypothetical protein
MLLKLQLPKPLLRILLLLKPHSELPLLFLANLWGHELGELAILRFIRLGTSRLCSLLALRRHAARVGDRYVGEYAIPRLLLLLLPLLYIAART